MDILSIIIPLIVGLVGLLPVVAIVVLVVLLVKKNNQPKTGNSANETVNSNISGIFSFKNLLRFYLFTITSAAVFIFAIGAMFLIKAGLGVINYNFSYGYDTAGQDYSGDKSSPVAPVPLPNGGTAVPNYVCYSPDTTLTKINGINYCYNNNALQLDLFTGAILCIIMFIIGGVHLFLLVRSEIKDPNYILRKSFTFLNLFIYAILSLIMIPISIYQTYSYLMTTQKPVPEYNTFGGSLGFAVVMLILWLVWLVLAVRLRNAKKQTA